MAWRKQLSQDARHAPSPWRQRLLIGGLLAALAAVMVFGRGSAAGWARRSAAHDLEVGAIGAAERSLDWAAWLSRGDERTDLLRARCFRRLGNIDAWRNTLAAAEGHGAPVASLELERKLGNIRWGQVENVSWGDYDALVETGAAPRDAIHAVVHGLLAKGQREKAQKLIDAWASDPADEGDAAFLRGICWWSAGKLESAQAEFENSLDRLPRHEMAHAGLARLLEDQTRYSQALEHDQWLVTVAPDRESVRVDLSRILRKLGRMEDARQALKPPAPGAKVSETMALELAEMEFESGNYTAAQRWFDQADLQKQGAPETIRTAASTAALLGNFARAELLFPRVDDPHGISRRRDELTRRIAIDPNDIVAAQELQLLSARPATLSPPDGDETSAMSPMALFKQHCAACHGAEGNGAGRAARHLNPRPRNLRADSYRLISTLNHVPTLADIQRVIREGIPGASMPSFARLPEDQQRMLAEEVQRLYGERFRERGIEEGNPGEILSVAAIGPPSVESIARGKEVYFKSGCHHCHGDDGTAATAGMMYDDEGRPTRPRNLVRDPMKGGSQDDALYRRIRLGMPGTPHPASPGLDEADVRALVQFLKSLALEPKQQLTNYEQAARAGGGVSSGPSDLIPGQSVHSKAPP